MPPPQPPPGWPVLTFPVLETELRRGVPGDPCGCAVFLALQAYLIGTPLQGRLLGVTEHEIQFVTGPDRDSPTAREFIDVPTTFELAGYIRAIDAGHAVGPAEFALDLTPVVRAVDRASKATATAAPTT
jgi:hypothetical protein